MRNITQLTNRPRIVGGISSVMTDLYSTPIEASSVSIEDNSEGYSEVPQNKPHINHIYC